MGGGAGVKIKQCPFCGSTETHVLKSAYTPDWAVECLTCEAIGPSQDGADVAVKSWNEGSPRWKEFFKMKAALEACAAVLCANEPNCPSFKEAKQLCVKALQITNE